MEKVEKLEFGIKAEVNELKAKQNEAAKAKLDEKSMTNAEGEGIMQRELEAEAEKAKQYEKCMNYAEGEGIMHNGKAENG
eukprot:11373163-Alexandrium_andersonii.AAC.1